jgi:hypothetical protein
MYSVIDFYEKNPEGADIYSRGSIWWACPQYVFERPNVWRFYKDRPTEMVDLTKFDANKEVADKNASTEPGEFLAIAKFKKRPVVILSSPGSAYKDRAWKGGEYYLVAPLRTLRSEITGEYKANPDFVWDAITYQYNSIFYLPADTTFDFKESVIQFDRIITLHQSWLLQLRQARLSQDALVCLCSWLQNYLFGKIPKKFNDEVETYREMVGTEPKIRAGLFGRPAA